MFGAEHPIDHALQFQRPRYCQMCSSLLQEALADGQIRPVCPNCGFVYFNDPKVATGAIIEHKGQVLLIRRNIPPSLGKWTYPGGYMNRGETTELAAIREVKEEVGLSIAIIRLLGVYSFPGRPVVVIVYLARVTGGILCLNSECSEARYFAPVDIPWDHLAFDSTRLALQNWQLIIG